jgi:hypothetical protein
LEGEIGIGGCKRCNISILKSLDGLFGRIDAVIMRFDKLELALLVGEKVFDISGSLMFHDNQLWLESLCC